MPESTSETREFLAKQSKALQTMTRLTKEIEALEKDFGANVYRIERLMDQARKLSGSTALEAEARRRIDDWLKGLDARAQSDKEVLRREFGVALERLLKEKGFQLEGHVPDLRSSYYTLGVDFDNEQGTIWYGPKMELLAKVRLSVTEMAARLETAHKALAGRDPDDAFLRRLYEAYRLTLFQINKNEGDHAPILQVLANLVFLQQDRKFHSDPGKDTFKEYRRAFFSYDLHRLGQLGQLRLGAKELSLAIATRSATTKRDTFLWIPSDDRGRGDSYASVCFREVK